MAPRKPETTSEQDPASDVAAQPAAPRPPQGITVRYMNTGDPRFDHHPRWKKKVRMIDPESLRASGTDPYLALPIQQSDQVRIRQVAAAEAAMMLSCDFATGGQPACRLATDEEVAKAEAEHEARRGPAEKSRAKDIARSEK